jgi:hypothetical protein
MRFIYVTPIEQGINGGFGQVETERRLERAPAQAGELGLAERHVPGDCPVIGLDGLEGQTTLW